MSELKRLKAMLVRNSICVRCCGRMRMRNSDSIVRGYYKFCECGFCSSLIAYTDSTTEEEAAVRKVNEELRGGNPNCPN